MGISENDEQNKLTLNNFTTKYVESSRQIIMTKNVTQLKVKGMKAIGSLKKLVCFGISILRKNA